MTGDKVVPFRKGPRPIPQGALTTLWAQLQLPIKGGSPVPNMDTAVRILQYSEIAKDLHWDTFLRAPMISPGVPLDKTQELELLLYMQRDMGVTGMKRQTVEESILYVAHKQSRNCVHDWLNSLPEWDGERRINRLFATYYGAEDNPYTSAAAINFMRSIIARALNPGCDAQNMIVLEGPQGIGKSRSLRALCPPQWVSEIHADLRSKDFCINLQGKLLMEVTELDAFSRQDVTTIKATISRPDDRYRGMWEKNAQDHPRQNIWVGTTNKNDWHRDETGGRRFWPIYCKLVSIDALRQAAPMLFAEALAEVRAKATWWEMPVAETQAEQDARFCDHPWRKYIEAYVMGRTRGVTTEEVMTHSELKLEPRFQTMKEKREVSGILKRIGWEEKRGRRREWWPPEREPGEDG